MDRVGVFGFIHPTEWQGITPGANPFSTKIQAILWDACGTFSQKGPYWLKARQDTWRSNGEYAEVILLLARDGTHFQIKHPYQDGGVHRIGFRVTEFNTTKRPVIEWKDFRWSRGV